ALFFGTEPIQCALPGSAWMDAGVTDNISGMRPPKPFREPRSRAPGSVPDPSIPFVPVRLAAERLGSTKVGRNLTFSGTRQRSKRPRPGFSFARPNDFPHRRPEVQ